MGTWKDHIENLRAEFIGKRIEYNGKPYTVATVDYNGIIHIDKASAHNPTTAVYEDYEARKHLIQPEPVAMEEAPTEAEKPQKPRKVCYNIVIYTTPDGIKRADIRNARTNSSYMDIPAADLDAIKAEILKTEPVATFSQSEIIPAEASTTANNTHVESPKKPRNDRQLIKYPHTTENATTGKIDAIQTKRPQTRTVDSFVKKGRFSRAITRKKHSNRTRYRTRAHYRKLIVNRFFDTPGG